MKKKLLAALLICLLLLSACQYIVVEDDREAQVGLRAARAEAVPSPAPTAGAAEAEPLARGSRDDEGSTAVRDLQARLIELNYLAGEADGIFGGATEAALTAFQRMHGLVETGVLDAATRAALASGAAVPMPTPEPTPLAQGAQGDGVREIQEALKLYGFLSGRADGDFGPDTDRALRAFQQYQYDMGLLTPAPTPVPEPTPTPTPAPTPEAEENGRAAELLLPQAEETEPAAPAYEPDGVVSDELRAMLTDGSFQCFREEVRRGSEGWEVLRLQRRLADLDYQWDAVDGRFGPNTEEALKYFQKRNNLEQTGIADEQTQRLLYSAAAVKSDKPRNMYMLKVSVSDQRVYAYKWANGSYSRLVKTMVCSTGTKSDPTPYGTYSASGPAGRWYYFQKFDCWAQYAYRISGPYLFHSVIYSQKDSGSLRKSSLNNLGSRASHGCVRLSVEDAKWIYNNCPSGTTVKVY